MVCLSIIVPVYNTEKYLKNCIESVLKQTFSDWELILVDDGSTDSSGSICDQYAQADNRIKVIHKPNGGLSAARNTGIDHSRGKYITFLDSDDDIAIDTYDKNIQLLLADQELEIVQFPVFEGYGENGGVLVQFPPQLLVSNREIQISFLEHLNHFNAAVWNKIYRSDILKNIRFVEGRLHEDYVYIDQLIQKLNKVRITNFGCYHYYHRPQSITHKSSIKRHLDLIDCDVSRLRRRYEFQELRHLLIEQFVFVVRELQNIHYAFPDYDLTTLSEEILKLKPSFKYLFQCSSAKDFVWYIAIQIFGLKRFTTIYQKTLSKRKKKENVI